MNELTKLRASVLEGYLTCLSGIDGDIGEFHSSAFLLERFSEDASVDLVNFLKPHASLSIKKVEKISGWGKYLETEIRSMILRKPLGSGHNKEDILNDRKRYVSFRIMDMIGSIVNDDTFELIWDIHGVFESDMSSARF